LDQEGPKTHALLRGAMEAGYWYHIEKVK